MCSFPNSAGKRIGNKCLIEKGIKHAIDRVMQKPVANTCFVDVSWFRIGDIECAVSAVFIGMIQKFGIKRKNVIHQLE